MDRPSEVKLTPRVLKITLTVTVRDMNDAEYADAMEGVEYDPVEWNDDHEDDFDPRAVVENTDASDYRELIEAALESEYNPELFAGTGIFAVMGAANIESIEWSDADRSALSTGAREGGE